MALTINNFVGFETQGLEESSSTSGSPDINTTIHRSGAACLVMDASTDLLNVSCFSGAADAGNDYIIGFAYRAPTRLAGEEIISVDADDSVLAVGLRINANNGFDLIGPTASVDSSANDLWEAGKWQYIEIWFEFLETANAKVFLDGVEIINSTARDRITAGTVLDVISINSDSSIVKLYDDIYFLSGAADETDRLGPVEVYMKQGAQTGTAPDTSALADTTLDEGDWENASETPLDEETQTAAASYTGGTVQEGVVYADGSGDKLGPNGDDRFTGVTIKAMKGIWRMARSGGGGTAQFGEIGNDGGAASDIETTADLDITASFANYEFLTETAATLPTLSEHAAIGFSKDGGGQDLDVAEMWVMLLVVPNAPNVTDLADAEWPDQNYHVGPFEI